MSNNNGYKWNRNAAHHRIAVTRFAAYSLIFSLLIGSLFLIGMGVWSDGTREYVAASATVVLLAIIFSWVAMFYTMCAMYVWINEEGRTPPAPPKEKPPEVWYQVGSGWERVEKKR